MSDQVTMTGRVSVTTVARGSKSEQVTAVLQTDSRNWLLRRAGGPQFGIDDYLAALDGQIVTVTGYVGAAVFLATDVSAVEAAAGGQALD